MGSQRVGHDLATQQQPIHILSHVLLNTCTHKTKPAVLNSQGTYIFFFLYTHTHRHCCSLAKSCPTLCDLMDCSPPGSSVHVVLQARILEWIAISFFRESPRPRNQTQVSCIGKCILYQGATRKVHTYICIHNISHTYLPYMLHIKYTYICHVQNIYTYICVNVSLEVFKGKDSLFILVSQYLTL